QILVNSMHGTVLGLLLLWIGVPNPLVWGILAAALRFIPYLGPMISTLAPILVALASSEGWSQTWRTAGALIGLELVTNNIVEPWVYGTSTGISTLAILVAAAFWTWVWGVIGLALSTPLTVCLLVLGQNFPRLRFFEVLIGDEPAMPAPSRLFHRMLAGSQDEAWDIVRNRAKLDGELVAADRLLLPALSLAGQAVREGTIGPEQRDMIASLTHTLVSELEDSRVPDEAPPLTDTPRILCVVARDAFDAVGCRLLTAELERRGCRVSKPGEAELFAETLARIRAEPPRVVCISSVAPTHFLQVRALCKRLLQASPEVQIVLGLWGEDLEHAELEQRLPASARIRIVTSLATAADQAAALAEVSGAVKQLRASPV
ncbi:MAG: AI-2E family transporter, partial [Planctomycetota bacterium]